LKWRRRQLGVNLRLPAIVLAVFIFFISLAQAQITGALHVTSTCRRQAFGWQNGNHSV
jgi:hypothetical protein